MRAVALVMIAAAACSRSVPHGGVEVRFTGGSRTVSIVAEVADDAKERARGLMGRRSLARDRGMVFVFERAGPHRFWMKDTLIPLDLAVVSAGRLIEVHRLEPCRTEDCPFTTIAPADRAVELAAGTLARAGIGVGARVEISGTNGT